MRAARRGRFGCFTFNVCEADFTGCPCAQRTISAGTQAPRSSRVHSRRVRRTISKLHLNGRGAASHAQSNTIDSNQQRHARPTLITEYTACVTCQRYKDVNWARMDRDRLMRVGAIDSFPATIRLHGTERPLFIPREYGWLNEYLLGDPASTSISNGAGAMQPEENPCTPGGCRQQCLCNFNICMRAIVCLDDCREASSIAHG
jgi:hypothetical protein